MHPIASLMAGVQFGDAMRVTRLDAGPSQFEMHFADETHQVDWPIEKDLAFRAHQLLEQEVDKPLPISMALTKYIPAGAGLGGGSGNAAGMFISVNRLYELGLEKEKLIQLGLTLGSDVGFSVGMMAGDTAAIVTGLGDVIEPVQLKQLLHLVLIFPPFGCPTGAVYKAFDELNQDNVADERRVRDLTEKSTILQDAPFNDLAEPACKVQPQLGELRESLQNKLALPVHITGSGSTMFVIAPSAITVKVLARKVTETTKLPAVATRTLA